MGESAMPVAMLTVRGVPICFISFSNSFMIRQRLICQGSLNRRRGKTTWDEELPGVCFERSSFGCTIQKGHIAYGQPHPACGDSKSAQGSCGMLRWLLVSWGRGGGVTGDPDPPSPQPNPPAP